QVCVVIPGVLLEVGGRRTVRNRLVREERPDLAVEAVVSVRCPVVPGVGQCGDRSVGRVRESRFGLCDVTADCGLDRLDASVEGVRMFGDAIAALCGRHALERLERSPHVVVRVIEYRWGGLGAGVRTRRRKPGEPWPPR